MPTVTFNNAVWVARYPEMSGVGATLGQLYFDEAGLYCANDGCNPANVNSTLSTLLYMLTSHIAWLNAPRGADGNPAATGQPAPAIVGRIATASEGSVSVSADMGTANGSSPSEAWYMQTKYGAAYWAATMQYRTMRYAAQPTLVGSPVFPYRR